MPEVFWIPDPSWEPAAHAYDGDVHVGIHDVDDVAPSPLHAFEKRTMIYPAIILDIISSIDVPRESWSKTRDDGSSTLGAQI